MTYLQTFGRYAYIGSLYFCLVVIMILFVLCLIPVVLYGAIGGMILAFATGIVLGLLYIVLFLLRTLLPDFKFTIRQLFEGNIKIIPNEDDPPLGV